MCCCSAARVACRNCAHDGGIVATVTAARAFVTTAAFKPFTAAPAFVTTAAFKPFTAAPAFVTTATFKPFTTAPAFVTTAVPTPSPPQSVKRGRG